MGGAGLDSGPDLTDRDLARAEGPAADVAVERAPVAATAGSNAV
jgi:hypothetical protein